MGSLQQHTYEYDKKGNKIKETKIFTTSPTKSSRTTTYSYNKEGQLIEEKTEDSGISRNNKHLKYEYDSNGKKTKALRFSQNDGNWEVSKTFSYDKNGNPILGDEETTFTFYENGLIKRELWKSSRSDETVNFVTTYEFY
jgi:YD repeat-containing protein